MTNHEVQDEREQRVLILAPTGRDAALTKRFLLEDGLAADACESVEELCREVNEGAGVLFLTGEALTDESLRCLTDTLSRQPAWSDIPIVVLTSGGGLLPSNAEALAALVEVGNVTLIERPVRVMTLMSTLKSALRARRRQYEVRDYLESEVRAREALMQSEERLRIALDAAQLGAWQLDLATGQMECTAICKRNFGLPPDADFSYDALMRAIHPDDRDRVRSTIERVLEERIPYRAEYRVAWPDGTIHWLLANGRAYFDASDRPHSMVGMTLDITERKRVEEERERLLHNEHIARREAEEASRLKDEFLATLSHELRTPLTAVLGWTHLLRAGQLNERSAAQALETVERNARAQQQLIEDLLDVSRIITGKLRLNVRSVVPSSFIEAAVESLLPAAEAKGIRLNKEIDPEAVPISGDPARLQQVVWNLLSNAIKFTPRGGEVNVKLELVNSHMRISVSDTGDGISTDFLPYVFDRFRQADGSTTRQYGGLGLGLAIVRHLVELHGGTVRAESRGDGQGATFTVSLPILTDYQPESGGAESQRGRAADARKLEGVSDLEGLKVLVVDDEADARDLMRALLTQCGAEVFTAESSPQALALLERIVPDAIISDIGMPDEDGYEFMRKVRLLPAERGGSVPAIALTAYARAEDRLRALQAGFQMHVSKPVEMAELVAVVAKLAVRI